MARAIQGAAPRGKARCMLQVRRLLCGAANMVTTRRNAHQNTKWCSPEFALKWMSFGINSVPRDADELHPVSLDTHLSEERPER